MRALLRKRLAVLAGIVVPALVITACGSDSDPDDDSGEGTTAESIVIALSDFGSEQMDPTIESRSMAQQGLLLMYDSILEIGDGGEMVPGLAESWQVEDDGVTWTFKLREGVQFHDDWGEVTAEDVKFSIEDRWGHENGTNTSVAITRSAIDHVEVVDDYNFKIVTKGVRADLPWLLAPHQSTSGLVFSKKYMTEEGGATWEEQTEVMTEHPIGSGPYKFVEHRRGAAIVYEAVEDHWRVTPVAKRVEIVLVPEVATQVAMLKSGSADIIELSPDQIADVEASGFEVRGVPESLGVGLLIVGSYRPGAAGKPTEDVRVRKALSLAIDREIIVDTMLSGRATLPTTPWNTTPLTADIDVDHWAQMHEEVRKHDVEEAKQLLAEAGFPNGVDGIIMDTYGRPGGVSLPQLAEIVVSQWAEAGIRATVRTQDYGNYRPHLTGAEITDDYNAGETTVYSSANRFDSVGALQTYWRFEGGAVQLLKDDALDELIGRVNGTADDDERMELVTEAFTVAHESWLGVPLFSADALYGINSEKVGEWATLPGYPFMGRLVETLK